MKHRIAAMAALFMVVSMLAACSNLNRVTPAGMDDKAIETEIRAKLTDDGITGLEINVDHGVVTLKGNVEKAEQRTKAVDTASHVNGVTRVIDQITVKM